MKEPDQKAIGFDPVKWAERLRDVNDGSQFSPYAKRVIENCLCEMICGLQAEGGDLPDDYEVN